MNRSIAGPAYAVGLALPDDLPLLPSIELATADMFESYVPEDVPAGTTSPEALRFAQVMGLLWVARADRVAVGFAHVVIIEPGNLHLEEIDVHPDHGRRGLGTRLVGAVRERAGRAGCGITLTTFRDVPWNMPFYARLGFRVLSPDEQSEALRAVVLAEQRRGLDPERRVVMRWHGGGFR